MEYFSCYYQVINKTQPVPILSQTSHIRRLMVSHDINDFVSPFIYSPITKTNYTRILTSAEKHDQLANSEDLVRVSEPVKVLPYLDWLANQEQFDDRDTIFKLYLVTPFTYRYVDLRVHYEAISSFYHILEDIRDRVRYLRVLKGIPSLPFKNKSGYILNHLQPVDATLTVTKSYARNKKTVMGMVGYACYDLQDAYKANPDILPAVRYFGYLMNHVVFGYRNLAMAFPYRADLEPIRELIPAMGNISIATQLVDYYPIFYRV